MTRVSAPVRISELVSVQLLCTADDHSTSRHFASPQLLPQAFPIKCRTLLSVCRVRREIDRTDTASGECCGRFWRLIQNGLMMTLRFNSLLNDCNIDPASVRLVRHKDGSASPGKSPYELWRDDAKAFNLYQSTQLIKNRNKFSAPFWAVFVADAFDDTLFVGLYKASYRGLLTRDQPMPHVIGGVDKAGTCDIFDLSLSEEMRDLIGRMVIDWGGGERAWVQYADRQNKTIREIRKVHSEPPYPGHLNFIEPLSRIGKLPTSWIDVLRSSRGVYILTCPQTKEQYIGSADGEFGFWGRWMQYFKTGHGGNVALQSRDPSDYQVAILEVAGSAADHSELISMEGRWQRKLQSREMGLNRNLARSR